MRDIVHTQPPPNAKDDIPNLRQDAEAIEARLSCVLDRMIGIHERLFYNGAADPGPTPEGPVPPTAATQNNTVKPVAVSLAHVHDYVRRIENVIDGIHEWL